VLVAKAPAGEAVAMTLLADVVAASKAVGDTSSRSRDRPGVNHEVLPCQEAPSRAQPSIPALTPPALAGAKEARAFGTPV
jgi:hypothetical protein